MLHGIQYITVLAVTAWTAFLQQMYEACCTIYHSDRGYLIDIHKTMSLLLVHIHKPLCPVVRSCRAVVVVMLGTYLTRYHAQSHAQSDEDINQELPVQTQLVWSLLGEEEATEAHVFHIPVERKVHSTSTYAPPITTTVTLQTDMQLSTCTQQIPLSVIWR